MQEKLLDQFDPDDVRKALDRRRDAGEPNLGNEPSQSNASRSPVTDQTMNQHSSPLEGALTKPPMWQEPIVNLDYEFGESQAPLNPFDTDLGLWTSSAGWDDEALQFSHDDLLQWPFTPCSSIIPHEHSRRPTQERDYSKKFNDSVSNSYELQIPVQLVHEL